MPEQQDNVTSNLDEKLNVNPDTGKSTSGNSEGTGTSGKDENIQSTIQKHAELRNEAEEKARKLAEEKEALEKQAAEMATKLRKEQEDRVALTLAGVIKSARISEKAKETYLQDPVKWFLAYSDNASNVSWDSLVESVKDQKILSGFVAKVEDVVGVTQPQQPKQSTISDEFTDKDNSGDTGNEGFDIARIKSMTPYELAKLPSDIKNTLMRAGSTSTE